MRVVSVFVIPLAVILGANSFASDAVPRPNIVIIMVDDI